MRETGMDPYLLSLREESSDDETVVATNEAYSGGDNTNTHDDKRKDISCPGRHFIENLQFHMDQP
jgi:hypothetical protein